MPNVICYLSGWFEINPQVTNFMHLETGEIKTLSEFFEEGVGLSDLTVESIEDASKNAFDGEWDVCDISLEEDGIEEAPLNGELSTSPDDD